MPVIEGAIAARVRGIIPITWDALLLDPRYGDALLQTAVNLGKESVTGTVVVPIAESAYSLVVIDYIAKIITLELIPAGIDFWMNQPISESATGTDENHSFTERAATLAELRTALLKETRSKADEIGAILGFRRASGKSIPRLNTINDELLTPSPQEFPRPFAVTERS